MTRRSSLRHDAYRAIEGKVEVRGRIGAWESWCLICGLDSGPWTLRLQAVISSLSHLQSHHAKADQ